MDDNDDIYYSRWDPEMHAGLLDSWFRAWGYPGLGRLDAYPDTGFVVDDCVAGFVYLTNSSIAIYDQWVSDPAVEVSRRRRALDFLHHLLGELCLERGYPFVSTQVHHDSLIRQAIEGHGFFEPSPDKKYRHIMRDLVQTPPRRTGL